MTDVVELAKVNAAIELKNLETAFLNGAIEGGYKAYKELSAQIESFLKEDLTEADIYALAEGEELEGLGKLRFKKFFKKITSIPKAIVKTAVKAAVTIPKATLTLTTAPTRALSTIGLSVALKALKGVSSRAFLYIFIPNDSPYLKDNPDVVKKRNKAIKVRDFLAKSTYLTTDKLNKQIRSNIISHYKKTPEQLIKQLSEGKGFQGLGEPITAATVITALAPIAIALIHAKYGQKDVPENGDFTIAIPKDANVTGELLPNGVDSDGNVVTIEDVQENGEGVVIKTDKATNTAGTIATWLGAGTAIVAAYNQLSN